MVEVEERLPLIQAVVPYARLAGFVRALHARDGSRDVAADDTPLRLFRRRIVGVTLFFRQLSLFAATEVKRTGEAKKYRRYV